MITVYGSNCDLDTVRNTELIRPESAGSAWKGLAHGELVDTILDDVALRGWTVTGSAWSLDRDGADLSGAFDLDTHGEIEMPHGVDLGLGIMTSNARRRALRIYCGGRVAVCNNGLATGEEILRKRHTTRTDFTAEIEAAIDKFALSAKSLADTVARLKSTKLSQVGVNDLIEEAGARKLIAPSRLWNVSREYYRPSHAEHGVGSNRSAWTLVNAFTEVSKKTPPSRQMPSIHGFTELVLARNPRHLDLAI
jgi:hypothetical protein